jgi:non-ribosomal peptide synthetase component F
MEYSTDLFDVATVDRMLAHYRKLLEEIIADPDQPIGAIPMLTPDERKQVLVGWNAEMPDDFAEEFDGPDDLELNTRTYEFSHTELAGDE